MPLPEAAGAVSLELVAEQVKAIHIHDALAELPVEGGDDFSFSSEQAARPGVALRKGDDVHAVGLGEVELGDVAGVEIDHRPSLISEMICVLSVPPWSLP
ncbi:MAG: hypothetical protein ABI318_22485 [Chthoniobacteraceae bacterium]